MGDYKHIYKIQSPEYLKDKSIKELEEIASEIRDFIIDKVSINGGHLSSNLGVVELTIAMHYVFNSPVDKLIFDVGHQSYVHKILTGRAKMFDKLRTMEGASGFPKYSESIHDVFEVGHSSTSISAMCGFIEERKTNKEIGEVVAMIGDGSLQNGLALAALNYLGTQTDQKGIIIINDNEMSISKNVGGMAQWFNKLRIRRSFKLVRKLTTVSFRNAVKTFIYRDNNMFNQLGYVYIGPIDGHNIKDLITYLEYAKKSNSSLILHVKTIKGKGYKFAEEDKVGLYHGISKFDKETGVSLNKLDEDKITFSKGVGEILPKFLDKYQNLKIITPAMIYGTGLTKVFEEYKDRTIDVGISEENACVMASVMSRCGSVPIVATYSTFFQRAYDQINHDICRSNEHVIFLFDHAGLVSGDGDTHQGVFDIAMLYSLPNIIIAAPANLKEFEEVLDIAINQKQPFVIRYPKCVISLKETANPTKLNKWKIIRPIREKNIIAYGPVVDNFKKLLENNYEIGLINSLFVKPIDIEVLKMLDNKTLYVYEDVILENSLSSKIIEFAYLNKLNINIIRVGINDFGADGTLSELHKKYQLDINDFINRIK